MSFVVSDSRKNFTPPPQALHPAICVDVIDLGMRETQWGLKRKVMLKWQLDVTGEDGQPMFCPETNKPFYVSRSFTASLNEKAALSLLLESWRGKPFTQKEREGFDIETVIGVCCQVQTVNNVADNGKTYCNVQAVVPLGRGMVKPAIDPDFVRAKDKATEHETGAADEDIPF